MQIDYQTQHMPDFMALKAALGAVNLPRFSGLTHDAIGNVLGVVFEGDDQITDSEKAVVDEIVNSLSNTYDWSKIRRQRNPLIVEADWRIQRAMDEGGDITHLIAYRRALRDITKQESPSTIVWPEKPW